MMILQTSPEVSGVVKVSRATKTRGDVAHRVGIGLGSAEPVEEALWEIVGDDRTGAGVVAVDDRRRAAIAHDVLQARRDGAERLVPGNRLELRFALGADAAQRRERPDRERPTDRKSPFDGTGEHDAR